MTAKKERPNLGTLGMREIFSMGVYQVSAFDANGNTVMTSEMPNSMNVSLTTTPYELRAGFQNPIQFLLQSSSSGTVTVVLPSTRLDDTNVALGGTLGYGGVIPKNVPLVLDADYTITLPHSARPAREMGVAYERPIARIEGRAYPLSRTETVPGEAINKLHMPLGEVGRRYCVTWFERAEDAQVLKIKTALMGDIVRLVGVVPLFAKPMGGEYGNSPEIGYRMLVYPQAQANPTVEATYAQDAPVTQTLTFTLLPYNEDPNSDEPCVSAETVYGYWQDYIYENEGYGNVSSIFIPGGGITTDAGMDTPINLMMERQSGQRGPVINFNDFEYVLNPVALGVVNSDEAEATLTGGTAGTGTLTITGKLLSNKDLSHLRVVAGVEVL